MWGYTCGQKFRCTCTLNYEEMLRQNREEAEHELYICSCAAVEVAQNWQTRFRNPWMCLTHPLTTQTFTTLLKMKKLVLCDLHFSMGMCVWGMLSDYKPLNDFFFFFMCDLIALVFNFTLLDFFLWHIKKKCVKRRKLQHSSWLICKQLKKQVSFLSLSRHTTNNTSNIFPSLKKTHPL